jgi:hypothetical protein
MLISTRGSGILRRRLHMGPLTVTGIRSTYPILRSPGPAVLLPIPGAGLGAPRPENQGRDVIASASCGQAATKQHREASR